MRGSGRHRQVPESPRLAKARQRAAKMGTMELLTLADTVISGIGRAISDYAQEGEIESLLEVRDEGLVALTAIVDDLILRHEAATS